MRGGKRIILLDITDLKQFEIVRLCVLIAHMFADERVNSLLFLEFAEELHQVIAGGL